MAEARATDAKVHAAKGPKARSRVIVRNAADGAFVAGKARPDVAEVALTKGRFGAIAGKRQQMQKILSSYADGVAEAKRTGRPTSFTLQISPDGGAETVPIKRPAPDALDIALVDARMRGKARIADILKQPDMLTARDFAPLVGVSHDTVHKLHKRHEVLGLQGAARGLRFPEWQATDDGRPLPGLPALVELLGDEPWRIYRFLKTHHAELSGRTALEAMKDGDLVKVLGAARNMMAGNFT